MTQDVISISVYKDNRFHVLFINTYVTKFIKTYHINNMTFTYISTNDMQNIIKNW